MKKVSAYFLFAVWLGVLFSLMLPSCKAWDEIEREVRLRASAKAAIPAHGGEKHRRVTVRARVKAGVPVHPTPASRKLSGRIPSGASVKVVDEARRGKWLLVRSDDGLAGWISHKYVVRDSTKGKGSHGDKKTHHRAARVRVPANSPWASAAQCVAVRKEGRARRTPGRIRVGTWNLRWFPYGSTRRDEKKRTDIAWMACAMASTGAEAFAIQEVVSDTGGKRGMRKLLGYLDRFTQGKWRVALDRCPGRGRQHVGVLWNDRVLKGKVIGDVAQLNPGGSACDMNLRPGFDVYLRSRRGGLDFHLVSVHLDSGTTSRDYEHRRRSVRGVAAAYGELYQRVEDSDMIVMGDFNTMGCEARGGCRPEVSWQQEVSLVEQQVARQHPKFRMLAAAPRCTEYYREHGQVLDQVLVSAGMAEAAGVSVANVDGVCGAVSCGAVSVKNTPAMQHLSDHCPVLVDLPDRDED